MKLTRTKAAWIRDEGYPVGKPAPGYFICNCGERLPAKEDGATCKCGIHFDASGWITPDRDRIGNTPTCALCDEQHGEEGCKETL